jgi:hypothetical protein
MKQGLAVSKFHGGLAVDKMDSMDGMDSMDN